MSVSYDEIPVRALIKFGDLSIGTPYINSIGVSRKRGAMCATFQASVRIHKEDVSGLRNTGVGADVVKIYAGSSSGEPTTNLPSIFTGYILNFSIQPDFNNADYVTLNMSGKDLLSLIEGQNVTRRAKATTMERWGIIESVLRPNKRFQNRYKGNVGSTDQMVDYDEYVRKYKMATKPESIKIPEAPIKDSGDMTPALSAQNTGQDSGDTTT